MPDQTQLVQSIYSAIFNGVAGAGALPNGASFLSLEWPGMPVSEAEYGNPWTATNTEGSAPSTQAFSALVDQIPANSPVYSPTGLGVESVYALILAATIKAAGPTAKVFADSQLQFASALIGSALDAQLSYHPSFPQPLGWSSPNSAGWTTITSNLASATPPKPLPPDITDAVHRALLTQGTQVGWRSAPINTAEVKKITVPIRVFPNVPPARLRTLPTAMFTAAAPVAARPAPVLNGRPFSQATAAMSQSRLNQALQMRTVTQTLSKPAAPAHAVRVPPGLFDRLANVRDGYVQPRIEPQGPPVVLQPIHTQPVTSSSLNLKMECMRVNILREWLNPLIFHLGNWSLDGLGAGSISTGDPGNNDGFFPLLPVSFLVIRNVSIAGTWSAEDKALATQASTAGNAVAFGPLTLSTGGATSSVFDGSTLTVPGMQVVAWFCASMPKLPPT